MLAVAVARYLADQVDGLVFDETVNGIAGNVFIAHMPSSPDVAVAIFPTGGDRQPTLDGSDSPTFQVRVRGAERTSVPSYDMARSIYSELTGLDLVTLDAGGDDEVFLISCTAMQSDPVPLGMDDNERHEWVLNFGCDVHAPTDHRPATLTP